VPSAGAFPNGIDPLRILHERPEECADRTLTRAQLIVLLLALIGAAVWAWRDGFSLLLAANALAIIFYTAQSLYKFHLVWRSLGRHAEVPVTPAEIAALRDEDLPRYTILLPLYRESEVLAQLVEALRALDYPAQKLDVQILLEEDDALTREAFERLNPGPPFRAVIVPDSLPKTKPKACNYGLYATDADLLVIYDAEDRPEPDQLKKAVAAFKKLPQRTICLQAKLNYYNQRQNLLTRWFTAEYSVWFDLFLPGLTASQAPIPLGGTSNHFKVPALQELGGWDPFNVTEDCDLGVRLHKLGYRTAVLDSTTWEEANSDWLGWIRQRSRWVKGYLQTYLVHMRRPWQLLRSLGWKDFFSFQMTIGGSLVCFLLNPVYWAITALWFATHSGLIAALFPTWLYVLGSLCLFVANFVFVYLGVAGCMQRKYYDLVKYAMFFPLYWLLMSVGAWKAFAQLITRPHYWEKTEHGLFPDGGASAEEDVGGPH